MSPQTGEQVRPGFNFFPCFVEIEKVLKPWLCRFFTVLETSEVLTRSFHPKNWRQKNYSCYSNPNIRLVFLFCSPRNLSDCETWTFFWQVVAVQEWKHCFPSLKPQRRFPRIRLGPKVRLFVHPYLFSGLLHTVFEDSSFTSTQLNRLHHLWKLSLLMARMLQSKSWNWKSICDKR